MQLFYIDIYYNLELLMMMHPDNEITLIQSCTRMSLNFNGFKIVVLETFKSST